MAFNITKTDGTALTELQDGTIDDSVCDLTLIGKNYVGYGTIYNDNLVHLLENFSEFTEPSNPLEGQLWWDKAGNLKVYTGETNGFKSLSTITTSNTAPSNAKTGNSWWDSSNDQLYVWGGSNWILVGPAFSANVGTSGLITEQIIDSDDDLHTVSTMYVQNQVVGIYSKDQEFIPQPLKNGFSSIKPGFNFISNAVIANIALWGSASQLGGIAATSYARTDIATTFNSNVTVLGNLFASNGNLTLSNLTVTSINATSISTGNITASNLTAASITLTGESSTDGSNSSAGFFTTTGTTSNASRPPFRCFAPGGAAFLSTSATVTGAIKIKLPVAVNNSGALISFKVVVYNYAEDIAGVSYSRIFEIGGQNAAGGWTKTYSYQLTNSGTADNVRFGQDASSDCIWIQETSATWNYPAIYITELEVASINTNLTPEDYTSGWTVSIETSFDTVQVGPVQSSKAFTSFSNNLPATDNVYNLGSASYRFANVYGVVFNGTSNQAKYADLAENFTTDKWYPAGTLVTIGGLNEITQENEIASDNVLGVISDKPGYLMNSELDNSLPVALSGKVPVRIIGPIEKGQRLISAGNGLAKAANKNEITALNIVGRSLENKYTTDEGTVFALVNVNK